LGQRRDHAIGDPRIITWTDHALARACLDEVPRRSGSRAIATS
jgi:hypothetical protein